jgi:hypothetical protein
MGRASLERMHKVAAAMEDPSLAGRGLAAIITFLLRRIEPTKRVHALWNLKRKIYMMDEFEMASKRTPATASLGQSITFIKTLLNGRPPYYIRSVLNNIVGNL